MSRLVLLVCVALPLAASLTACAADPKPVSTAQLRQVKTPNSYVSDAQNLANMTLQRAENDEDKSLAPCPRFLRNISAAESAVDMTPRDYPHML